MDSLVYWWAAGVAHEFAHIGAACCVGRGRDALSTSNFSSAIGQRVVVIPNTSVIEEKIIRHSGWAASVVLALVLYNVMPASSASFAAGLVALEAIASDLFGAAVPSATAGLANAYHCGNFGLVLMDSKNKEYVIGILQKMVQVTMMRGAQCGGVVTYVKGSNGGLKGLRCRVINGKRTNLSELVASKLTSDQRLAGVTNGLLDGPRLYAGHTRFATTSKVTFDGTHPHQWSPPRTVTVYAGDWSSASGIKKQRTSHEVFICHNGDFDAFEIDGTTFELGNLFSWLPKATGAPAPSTVDSVAVAGVIDLLRCQGSWFHSLRLAFLMGGGVDHGTPGLDYKVPPQGDFESLANAVIGTFDRELQRACAIKGMAKGDSSGGGPRRASIAAVKTRRASAAPTGMSFDAAASVIAPAMTALRERLPGILAKDPAIAAALQRWSPFDGSPKPTPSELLNFSDAAVQYFFDNDLLHTVRYFLKNATGSFGLCVNTSVDSKRQVVVAARGQTISVAFYPRLGLVVYGSEAAATKAPLTVVPAGHKERLVAFFKENDPAKIPSVDRMLALFKDNEREMWALLKDKYPSKKRKTNKVSPISSYGGGGDDLEGGNKGEEPGTRIDLDDLGGEVCLLDWGNVATMGPASCSSESFSLQQEEVMGGKATVTLAQESLHKFGSLDSRLVRVEEDERVLPLPSTVKYDPVGADLEGIPKACFKIQRDWSSGNSPNRVTAWYFGRELNARLASQESLLARKANRVDLLVTGCEVSLWSAEQFAADLSLVFPSLVIKTMSSNKLLGLFGQSRPMQATGFGMTEDGWDLTGATVLIVSHSGGTFSPLAVSNLLQSETNAIYVVTSEWDTQIGKQLRQIGKKQNVQSLMKCRIFSTDIGLHPAEPCTISVAATHQLLTEILTYLMGQVYSKGPHAMSLYGAKYERDDICQLERCNQENIAALEEIIGVDRDGITRNESELCKSLRKKGNYWAQHVLESPRSWCLCALYVLGTVIFKCPLFGSVIKGLGNLGVCDEDLYEAVWVGVLDAVFYLFTPQIFTWLIRAVQCRPMGHRMGGRSVVIGDVPWVAQCVEAMASKLFACTYNNTGVSFYSGNPADHLVHRFTHRVVRGGLLAVGRPDGRLAGLASTEASVCLSVNQASSIQNLGVTLESLTIGHNPYKLPLSAMAEFLPTRRPDYLSEREVKTYDLEYNGAGKSANALLGDFENLWKRSEQDEERRRERTATKGANTQTKRLVSHADEVNSVHGTTDRKLAERLGDVEASKEDYFGENLEMLNSGVPIHILIEKQQLSERLYENRIASMQRLCAFFVLFHQMGKDVMNFWTNVSVGLLGYEMDRTHSIMRIATTASPVSGAAIRQRMVDLEAEMRVKKAKDMMRRYVRNQIYGRHDNFDDEELVASEEQLAAKAAEEAAQAKVQELKDMMAQAQAEIHKALADAEAAKKAAEDEAKLSLRRAKEEQSEKRIAKKRGAKKGTSALFASMSTAEPSAGPTTKPPEPSAPPATAPAGQPLRHVNNLPPLGASALRDTRNISDISAGTSQYDI